MKVTGEKDCCLTDKKINHEEFTFYSSYTVHRGFLR